jgi:prevent-host-death family protein
MQEERVSIGRLKARLSEYLRRARGGRGIIVTDRGRPVARLVGLKGEAAVEGRVAELVRSGLARPPERPLDSGFLGEPRPVDPEGRSLETILEERSEGW